MESGRYAHFRAQNGCGGLADPGPGLLAEILAEVPGAAASCARGSRALPASEGLDVGPGAGGGAGGPVHIGDPGLDLVEPALDLLLVAGEETGGETEGSVVGESQTLVEILDRTPPATLWLGLAGVGLLVAAGQILSGPRRDRRIAALTKPEVRHEALVG